LLPEKPQEVQAPARLRCHGAARATEEQGEGNGWWKASNSAAQCWAEGTHKGLLSGAKDNYH